MQPGRKCTTWRPRDEARCLGGRAAQSGHREGLVECTLQETPNLWGDTSMTFVSHLSDFPKVTMFYFNPTTKERDEKTLAKLQGRVCLITAAALSPGQKSTAQHWLQDGRDRARPHFGRKTLSFSFSLLCQLPVSCWPNAVLLVYFPSLNFLWDGLCYAQFEITQPLWLWASAKRGASLAILGILGFNRKEFTIKNTFKTFNLVSLFQFHLVCLNHIQR